MREDKRKTIGNILVTWTETEDGIQVIAIQTAGIINRTDAIELSELLASLSHSSKYDRSTI